MCSVFGRVGAYFNLDEPMIGNFFWVLWNSEANLNTKQGDNEQFYREAVFEVAEKKVFHSPRGCYNAFYGSFDEVP